MSKPRPICLCFRVAELPTPHVASWPRRCSTCHEPIWVSLNELAGGYDYVCTACGVAALASEPHECRATETQRRQGVTDDQAARLVAKLRERYSTDPG
jgi:hypothetical protein